MTGWDTSNIPDQSGRTFIVTGANNGIGAATTRALTAAGGRVVMACRDEAKARAVAGTISDRVRVQRLDLADLASVREFAEDAEPADVLINNAGVSMVPLSRTADGFEMHVGTNHLGHFALTALLLDKIGDRIVTVSSKAVSGSKLAAKDNLTDLNWELRRYRAACAYSDSKLANLLFAQELQRRLTASGSAKLSVAAHPGYAATHILSHTDSLFARCTRPLAQSAEMGALPTLYAAVADVEPGGFYGPSSWRGWRGYPGQSVPPAVTRDEALARRLWQLSEELTRVTYPFDAVDSRQ